MDTPRQVKNDYSKQRDGENVRKWNGGKTEKKGAMDEGRESSAVEQTGISTWVKWIIVIWNNHIIVLDEWSRLVVASMD